VARESGLSLLEDIRINARFLQTSFLRFGKDFDMAVHGILNRSYQL